MTPGVARGPVGWLAGEGWTLADLPESGFREMRPGEVTAFLTLLREEREGRSETADVGTLRAWLGHDPRGRVGRTLAVMVGRLAAAGSGLRYSPALVLFLASLCGDAEDGRLWGEYLTTAASARGGHVDMCDFAMDFASGIPACRLADVRRAG